MVIETLSEAFHSGFVQIKPLLNVVSIPEGLMFPFQTELLKYPAVRRISIHENQRFILTVIQGFPEEIYCIKCCPATRCIDC